MGLCLAAMLNGLSAGRANRQDIHAIHLHPGNTISLPAIGKRAPSGGAGD